MNTWPEHAQTDYCSWTEEDWEDGEDECWWWLANCEPDNLETAVTTLERPLPIKGLEITLQTQDLPRSSDALQRVLAPLLAELQSVTVRCNCLEGTRFDSELLSVLVDQCLIHSPKLNCVKLDDCCLDEFAGIKIGNLLSGTHWTVETLLLHRSWTSIAFSRQLRAALEQCPVHRRTVRKVELLDHCQMSLGVPYEPNEDSVAEFISCVALFPALEELYFSTLFFRCILGGRNFESLIAALQGCQPRLKRLRLNGSVDFARASERNLLDFSETLAGMEQLEVLELPIACLGSNAAVPLLCYLQSAPSCLHTLDLNRNDEFLSTVEPTLWEQLVVALWSLPALQNVVLPFLHKVENLAILLKRLVESGNSTGKSLSIWVNCRNFVHDGRIRSEYLPIDSSWLQYIPLLGFHVKHLTISVCCSDKKRDELTAAVAANYYLISGFTKLEAVYQRNKFLAKLTTTLQNGLTRPQQWPILLEGVANQERSTHTIMFVLLKNATMEGLFPVQSTCNG